MIGGVKVKANGKSHAMRLSIRAMEALEDEYEKPIIEVIVAVTSNPKISDLVPVLSELMDDGSGADCDAARGLIEALGVIPIQEAIDAAFSKAWGMPKGAKGESEKPGNDQSADQSE